MKEVSKGWIGGFFDSDGSISLGVKKMERNKIGYGLSPCFMVGQSIETYERTLPLVEEHLYNNLNVEVNINTVQREEYCNMKLLQIRRKEDVKKTLRYLEEEIHNKQNQVKILLEEIFPRMEINNYLSSKEDFMEIIAWKEAFDSYKGGIRSKYTVEYFEKLWNVELSDDKYPSDNIFDGAEVINIEGYTHPAENGSVFDY